MPDTFHFIRPEWLAAIPAAVLLGLLWARRSQRLSRWKSRIDPALLGALLEDTQAGGGWRLPWILALSLAAGAIGLAGPAWERSPQAVEQRSDALVILLDLSLSMFAEDVPPSRLVRARQKITDILRLRHEGATALIAYAGNAHTVVPLTEDAQTIENLLSALSPDIMPVFGSNLGEAIELARELLRNSASDQGLILVITDGVDQVTEVTERRDIRYPISILGIGTAAGGTIPLRFPDRPAELLRTQQGEAILARLDEPRLRSISEMTYGRYRSLAIGDDDVIDLLATPLAGPETTREVERRFDLWADQGFWAAILLLPALLLGFRRGIFALLPLLAMPGPADASLWDDLWSRPDQQAYQQLQEGQPEQAAALFEDPVWRAIALYRSGDYARAGEAFAAATVDRAAPDASPAHTSEPHAHSPVPPSAATAMPEPGRDAPTALYNMGNALARQGDYQAAIERYDAALERDPGNADARFNRDLIQKLQDDRTAADSNRDQDQASRDAQQDDAEHTERPDPDADASPQEPGSEPQKDGKPSEQDPDAQGQPDAGEPRKSDRELSSEDADRDALEQWLRRIPDDPGGLLRRKFQYETNERLRRGEYRAADQEQIW